MDESSQAEVANDEANARRLAREAEGGSGRAGGRDEMSRFQKYDASEWREVRLWNLMSADDRT